jgi:uncharacterized membrane protein (DUF373 family)
MEFGHSILHASARVRSIVQVKTILLVALLAVARKFILLDIHVVPAATIAGLALALLTLGTVYWLLRERDDRQKPLVAKLPIEGSGPTLDPASPSSRER